MLTSLVILCITLSLGACDVSGGDEPRVVSRELLGTAVSVTAYGEDAEAVRAAVDESFELMERVAGALDAYSPDSPVSALNRDPGTWTALPGDVWDTLGVIGALGLGDAFSPGLWGVMALYDFGGEGTVPPSTDLDAALAAARSLELDPPRARFSHVPTGTSPGLDLGGVAKGYVLDVGADALRVSGDVDGALLTAGSTTVVFGEKPDGSAWRIGVEDPRALGTVVAVFEADGRPNKAFSVSTSGDYQQYFERDGRRYHHILDPATGEPASSSRSVTVADIGMSGAETDVLATALFVVGPDAAEAYARDAGYALYIVDDTGRAHVTPGPDDSILIEELAEPTR